MKKLKQDNYFFIPGASYPIVLRTFKQLKEEGNEKYLKKALQDINPYILISYGNLYKQDKNDPYSINYELKAVEPYGELMSEVDAKMYLDSGGFQIMIGQLPESEIKYFMEKYYDFVKAIKHKFKDNFEVYFYLDILFPGKDPVVTEYYNMKTIEAIKNKEIYKDKDLWNSFSMIMQFSTFERYHIWDKVVKKLDEFDLLPEKYGLGSIAKQRNKFRAAHILVWAFGFFYTLDWLYNKKKIDLKKQRITLHILGIVDITYVVSFYLINEYLKYKYGFDFNITYDGTAYLRLVNGKSIPYIDEKKHHHSVSIRHKDLDKYLPNSNKRTAREYLIEIYEKIFKIIGYKPTEDISKIYIDEESGFVKDLALWSPFVDPIIHLEYYEKYLPLAQKAIKEYVDNGLSDYIQEYYHITLNSQNKDNRVSMYKRTLMTLRLIDKTIEEGLDFIEDILLPSANLT